MQDMRWKPDLSVEPHEKWWALECEMNRKLGLSTIDADEGLALRFVGVSDVDGKHECRPATAAELRATRATEIEFEQLCTHEQTSAKQWRLKTHEILITVFGH